MKIPFPNTPKDILTEMDSIKGKAMQGAFRKGVIACREVGLEAVNPYKAKYQPDGRGGTFAMAFRNHWNKGWNAWKKHVLGYAGIDHREVKDKTINYQ